MISVKKYVRKDVQKDVLFNMKKHELYYAIFYNLFAREKIRISKPNIFYQSADHSFLQ